MEKVRVKRLELLDILRKNRKAHLETFQKALAGYREVAIEELDRMIEEAKAGKRIRRQLELIEPTNHTKDYDRVISMLEMCIDNTIELAEDEVGMYVMDDWRWKEQFTQTSAHYTS